MELAFVVVAVFFTAYFFAFPTWRKWELARERRRHPGRTKTQGMVGVFDEVFHPHAYYANLEWQAQRELPLPAPDSDKKRPDVYSGRVTIEL
jgi:hypothetical protein